MKHCNQGAKPLQGRSPQVQAFVGAPPKVRGVWGAQRRKVQGFVGLKHLARLGGRLAGAQAGLRGAAPIG